MDGEWMVNGWRMDGEWMVNGWRMDGEWMAKPVRAATGKEAR